MNASKRASAIRLIAQNTRLIGEYQSEIEIHKETTQKEPMYIIDRYNWIYALKEDNKNLKKRYNL